MSSTNPSGAESPISLDSSAAGGLDSPSQLANRLVATWFAARQRPYVQTGLAFAATIGPRAEGEAPIEFRIGTTPGPVGILFSASAALRYDRDSWPAALATCNQWNGSVPVPTARLAVSSWDDDTDAPVVLEAWLPLTPGTEQAAVDTIADAFVHGVVSFWRPPTPSSV
jgi:hypothetical protein